MKFVSSTRVCQSLIKAFLDIYLLIDGWIHLDIKLDVDVYIYAYILEGGRD